MKEWEAPTQSYQTTITVQELGNPSYESYVGIEILQRSPIITYDSFRVRLKNYSYVRLEFSE
jgi:hypothetical protein